MQTDGINNFAVKPETVAKWVLGRPFQTRYLEALFDICGRSRSMTNPRKCLRSSGIKRSNTMVEKVINVITQFLNPLDDLEKEQRFSLVSGVPVDETITENLTSIKQNAKHAMCNFVERLTRDEHKQASSTAIKKSNLKSFQDGFMKAKIFKNGKEREIRSQSDILRKLMALFCATKAFR